MLENFDHETQTLEYHCHNPKCDYHNCKNWESFRSCEHHDKPTHVLIPAEQMRHMLLDRGVPPREAEKAGDALVLQPSRAQRVAGATRKHHISEDGIEWVDPNCVALPPCECGSRMTLKVHFTEEELEAPNIKTPHYDPAYPGMIVGVTQHPAVERHGTFAEALKARGNVYQDPSA